MEILPMKKFISFIFLLSVRAFATSQEEEAIILNQELEFLKESANNIKIISEKVPQDMSERKPRSFRTLEETYFDDYEEDKVSTRSAARKREQN